MRTYAPGDPVAVHQDPVRKPTANYILRALVDIEDGVVRWEQLWTKKVAENRFELCCIPFFICDLALGDEVTKMDDGTVAVLRPSGQWTFHAWFDGATFENRFMRECADQLVRMNVELEWSSPEYLAVSAGEDQVDAVIDTLARYSEIEGAMFEISNRGSGGE